MTEQQVEWKNYRGTYLGLAEAPKSGQKKDGSMWTKNKLNFTHAQDKQVKFGTFNDISGLQVGQNYAIVFKEDSFKLQDGTDARSKTAVKIELHTDPTKPLGFEQPLTSQTNTNVPQVPQDTLNQPQMASSPNPVPNTTNQQSAVVGQINASSDTSTQQSMVNQQPLWDDNQFAELYRASVKIPISEKTLENFIGTYVMKHPMFIELKTKLEQLFNTAVHPR